MIPNRFDYIAPDSLPGVIDALSGDPDGAKVLGGGTWLVPDMNAGAVQPHRVVDLRNAGLGGIERENGHIRIGAMTTYADLIASDIVESQLPLLHTMAMGVTGGRQITQQGTIGGSAVAARPQSDAPATLTALSAVAVVAGPDGERRIAAAELFAAAMRTTLRPGEVVAGFEVPSAAGLRHGYFKLKRGTSSWPVATAACLVGLDDDGRCSRVTLALGGVQGTPVIVDVGDALVGREPSPDALEAAADRAGSAVSDPWGDVLAPPEYRAAVAGPVARRALTMACNGGAT